MKDSHILKAHNKGKPRYPLKGSDCQIDTSLDDFLTSFEKTEIEEFEEVWFMAPMKNKYQATKLERLVNNGFDDAEGYYRLKPGDQIGYRFEIVE